MLGLTLLPYMYSGYYNKAIYQQGCILLLTFILILYMFLYDVLNSAKKIIEREKNEGD